MSRARAAVVSALCVSLATLAGLAPWTPVQAQAPHTSNSAHVPASSAGKVQGGTSAPAARDPTSYGSAVGDMPEGGPGDWTLPGRDYASSRYSPLDQITPQNVKSLHVAWTFSTGVPDGHEGNPLVVNNTMYIVTPLPNYLYALDLTKPGAPLKWKYAPKVNMAAHGEACCDAVNRGMSYTHGKIIYNTLDDHVVAVDANTGKQLWSTQIDSIEEGATTTMAAFVVKDKVIVGNSGAEMGVRGFVAALDVNTGKILWKAYSTGPDSAVLINPATFKPFYPQLRGKNLGVTTWPPDQWKRGGGTVWGWISYDPELDLIFYGTANPGVWNADQRPGDNLWSTSVFARDPDTGEAKWAYQFTPHDAWDYDAIMEFIPLDLTIDGKQRHTVFHVGRNGFGYTLDRTSGQVLVANPYQYVNWATGIDLKTGRPQEVPSKRTHQGVNTLDICPASIGARDEQPAAFSPRTGLIYTGTNHACMDYEGLEAGYIAGTPYLGASVKMYPGPGGNRGEFIAWDPVSGTKKWGIKEKWPVWSGVLATGGDVVFYGTMDGWFKAVDAKSGQLLWQFKTGSGIVGNPISYLGPDGKQYIAVYSGVGGWTGAVVPGMMSPDDPTAGLGVSSLMGGLRKETAPGNMLYVFALP
ncbi:MAG TPA: methanol/ethanol family PQQ-dependent dehydrogenase [Gemmatimonadaceae bacterium]|nr:methanol/ethanol family PQQ-dependent dehydrogenase [Gemmatimonadaceae bacterium]